MRNEINILWDGSHIWGLLAWHGLRALGLPCRLLKAQEIACKWPQCKGGKILLVPGGNARKKALALGRAGLENIRSNLAAGGAYLGFCGGAGLALAPAAGEESLGLCPWPRAAYENRLSHLVSGYLKGRLLVCNGRPASLPVWWPGRFAPLAGKDVEVLAECVGPDKDFWLADIPLGRLPEHLLAGWLHGQKRGASPFGQLPKDYFSGAPLAVRGNFGAGRYILSYSHLETPESGEANLLLCNLLEEICRLKTRADFVPAWTAPACAGEDLCGVDLQEVVGWANCRIARLLQVGTELRLFFHRASWLLGWRSGLPGMACNNLRMALGELGRLAPTEEAEIFWAKRGRVFVDMAREFFDRAETALLTAALAETQARVAMQPAPGDELTRVFGHPMLGGGMAEDLLAPIEELIYLAQPKNEAE